MYSGITSGRVIQFICILESQVVELGRNLYETVCFIEISPQSTGHIAI